jgi:hypothetical protein
MEVKLFVHRSATEAEKAVNEWLGQNNVTIKYIGQSQSEQGGKFVFIISVFYAKKTEPELAAVC